MNRWMKYLALASTFAGIGGKIFTWLQQSQAPGSDEGDNITSKEAAELQPIIEDAINQGLQAAEIPIVVSIQMTYVGE